MEFHQRLRVTDNGIAVILTEIMLLSTLLILLDARFQSALFILAPILILTATAAYFGYTNLSFLLIYGIHILVVFGTQFLQGAVTTVGHTLTEYIVLFTIYLIVASVLTIPGYFIGETARRSHLSLNTKTP